jgi:hypothetical protein
MYSRILLSVTLIAVLSPFCRGATVALDDGRIFDGTVIAEDNYGYLMNIKGARVQLPRSKVRFFSQDTVPHDKVNLQGPRPPAGPVKQFGVVEMPPPAPGVQPAPAPNVPNVPPNVPNAPNGAPPPAGPPAANQPAGPVAPQIEVVFPAPRDANEAAALKQAIDDLREDADPTNRPQALETIRAAGDIGLGALLEYGLYHPLPSIRATAAQLLAQLGGPRVLKYLIEAFYSAGNPTIPPFNREYVRVLTGEISRLTAQDFYFYARRSNRAPEIAQKMMEWWAANADKLPPQLGEPLLDQSRPDYAPIIHALRTLRLEHRDFAGINLPPDIAGPPVPNTVAENEFLATFPVMPRWSIDSGIYISWSHTPTVEKYPPIEQWYPGMVRRAEFADKWRAYNITLHQEQQGPYLSVYPVPVPLPLVVSR